jgi:hypothetical protein
MNPQDAGYASGASSLVECTQHLAELGYTAQASSLEGGFVQCEGCDQPTPAADVRVDALYRLEGASDPDDMSAVLGVVCPSCELKATLVLHYGPMASADDADVLAALPDPPPPVEVQ